MAVDIPDWAVEESSSVPDWAQTTGAPTLLNQKLVVPPIKPVPQFNFQPTKIPETIRHGSIQQTPFWEDLGNRIKDRLGKVFPGYGEKGTSNPVDVLGGASMVLPVGLPAKLGVPLMAYFGAKTVAAQPQIYQQVKDELQRGDYTQAQKDAVEDVLQLSIAGFSGMAMRPEGAVKEPTLPLQPSLPPKPPKVPPILPKEAPKPITTVGEATGGVLDKLKIAPEVVPDWAKPQPKTPMGEEELKQRFGVGWKKEESPQVESTPKPGDKIDHPLVGATGTVVHKLTPSSPESNVPAKIESITHGEQSERTGRPTVVVKLDNGNSMGVTYGKDKYGNVKPIEQAIQEAIHSVGITLDSPTPGTQPTSVPPKPGSTPSPEPPKSDIQGIRPAIRTMDGKIHVGDKGAVHNDIIARDKIEPTNLDRRLFVDDKGNEISREQLAKMGVPETEAVPGAHAPELAKVQEQQKPTGKDIESHIGATYDAPWDRGGGLPRLLQFTWRAKDVPKDSPVYGATFYIPEGASLDEALAKAKAKADEFGVKDYQANKAAEPVKSEPPSGESSPNELNARIDEIVKIGADRRKAATPEMQGLLPSDVEWLTSEEAAKLHELKLKLPSFGQLAVEARQRLAAKRNKGASPTTEKPPSVSPQPPTPVSLKQPKTAKSSVAKVEDAVKPKETQPELIGMGAAKAGEVETGSGGDIYGIAERVRAERAKSGQVASVPPGEGISAPDSIERGRTLLSIGEDAEEAVKEYERTKALSADTMALARAHGEKLSLRARKIEEQYGTMSDEYKEAWNELSDWDTRTKPMQTEWHKIGEAQQGYTDIDTGSFTGLQSAYHGDTGKEFTPKQAETATKIAKNVKKATNEAETAKDKVFEAAGVKTPKEGQNAPTVKQTPKKANLVDDRKAFEGWKKGDTMTPEQVKTLWNRAKAYLDAGETDFDNIRHKLATELGIPVNDVTKGLAQPKGIKAVTDDMYRKMSEQRRLVSSAKNWIKNQQMPGWLRFFRNVPRIFFIDKVFGHGTVGMITHAGLNIFNPGAWKTYFPNFLRQYKLLGWHDKGAYHERMMQDLIRDPLYVKARRAGLANDPFRYTDDYQNAFSQWFGKLGLTGNRGFDALKLFRQARFSQIWNNLPDNMQTKEMASMVSDSINHATGVVKMPFREWANWTFFAPKLEGSRWAWMVGDPLKAAKTFADWNNSTPEAQRFAMSELKQKAVIAGVYYSLLAANQGILSASGSKQSINFTDPRRSDFMSFKLFGHDLGVVGPMLGMVRLFANIVHASVGKRGKLESLTPRAGEVGQEAEEYLRGKLSPFSGFGVDVFSQADYAGRPMPWSNDRTPAYLRRQGFGPYTYGQYAAQEFTPIPVSEAIKEVWKNQGMSESEMNTYLNALLVGVTAGATGARLSADTHQEP